MTKETYIKSLLKKLKEHDLDSPYQIVSQYEKLIDEELKQNDNFDEVVKKIGDVDSVVSKVISENKKTDDLKEEGKAKKKTTKKTTTKSKNDDDVVEEVKEEVIEVNNNNEIGYGTHISLFFLRLLRIFVAIIQYSIRIVTIISITIYVLVAAFDKVDITTINNDNYKYALVELCTNNDECIGVDLSYSSETLLSYGILKDTVISTYPKDKIEFKSNVISYNTTYYDGFILPVYLETAIAIALLMFINASITIGITRKLKKSIRHKKKMIRGVNYE